MTDIICNLKKVEKLHIIAHENAVASNDPFIPSFPNNMFRRTKDVKNVTLLPFNYSDNLTVSSAYIDWLEKSVNQNPHYHWPKGSAVVIYRREFVPSTDPHSHSDM